jgi:hypothetical protein
MHNETGAHHRPPAEQAEVRPSARKREEARVLCRWPSILAATWCIAAVIATAADAGDSCQPLPLLEPREPTIAESRPTFKWQPLPGVQRYRVRLQSRVPEGELVASIDSVIEGSSFVPPRPLAAHRALVTIHVSASCEEVHPAGESGRLVIDTGLACRLDPLEEVSGGAWTWDPAADAIEYEVFRYAMPSGKLLSRSAVPGPVSLSTESGMLAVRARCANGFSDLRFAP